MIHHFMIILNPGSSVCQRFDFFVAPDPGKRFPQTEFEQQIQQNHDMDISL